MIKAQYRNTDKSVRNTKVRDAKYNTGLSRIYDDNGKMAIKKSVAVLLLSRILFKRWGHTSEKGQVWQSPEKNSLYNKKGSYRNRIPHVPMWSTHILIFWKRKLNRTKVWNGIERVISGKQTPWKTSTLYIYRGRTAWQIWSHKPDIARWKRTFANQSTCCLVCKMMRRFASFHGQMQSSCTGTS